MMVGIPLVSAAAALSALRKLLGAGWIALTGGVAGNVLTLSPSYVLQDAQIEAFATTLDRLVPLSDRAGTR
jgi:4-aminobutyrate aminotransferase/(S)-3-amino-2-methylpropionate transaminase